MGRGAGAAVRRLCRDPRRRTAGPARICRPAAVPGTAVVAAGPGPVRSPRACRSAAAPGTTGTATRCRARYRHRYCAGYECRHCRHCCRARVPLSLPDLRTRPAGPLPRPVPPPLLRRVPVPPPLPLPPAAAAGPAGSLGCRVRRVPLPAAVAGASAAGSPPRPVRPLPAAAPVSVPSPLSPPRPVRVTLRATRARYCAGCHRHRCRRRACRTAAAPGTAAAAERGVLRLVRGRPGA
ncbi:hypothetical protein QF030_000493, partial [Streptomyces rishiriensis]|nr:hypothetical protein [Streptomyces rishiriensis]